MIGARRCSSPNRTAKQWNEIPAEKLPKVFETHLPICWNCYITETFRRVHPELVLNRAWDRGAGGEYAPKEESKAGRAETGKSRLKT